MAQIVDTGNTITESQMAELMIFVMWDKQRNREYAKAFVEFYMEQNSIKLESVVAKVTSSNLSNIDNYCVVCGHPLSERVGFCSDVCSVISGSAGDPNIFEYAKEHGFVMIGGPQYIGHDGNRRDAFLIRSRMTSGWMTKEVNLRNPQ